MQQRRTQPMNETLWGSKLGHKHPWPVFMLVFLSKEVLPFDLGSDSGGGEVGQEEGRAF